MDRNFEYRRAFENELNDLQIAFSKLSVRDTDIESSVHTVFNRASAKAIKKNRINRGNIPVIPWLCNFFQVLFFTFKYTSTCLIFTVFIYAFVTAHPSAQKIILRNSQNYIYPVMRTLRIWTLPLLENYEILSDWHEEECLIQNPFYYELPLDCWPCEDIRTLVDLTGFYNYSNSYVYNEQPFIVRDSISEIVSFGDLQKIYQEYSMMLDRGTAKFLCSEKDFCYPKDVFTKKAPAKNSFEVMWKINRVAAARVVRKIFPRPYFVPHTSEVALERYLYLGGAEAPQFFLPLTDFANVWVAQGQGYRLIVLDPSEPCITNCSTVSVLLRPRDVLYYNWQFWRPRSRPANFSKDMSITYVGSFY